MPTAQFWAYDTGEPSYRYRMAGLLRELERRGWHCDVEELPKRRYLIRVLERRARLRACDVLLMHKIKATPLELWPLRRYVRRLVFDIDDAIYFRRPRRLGDQPDRGRLRQLKFARTCAAADLVTAGNRTLAAVAGRSARRVEVVPTPVDLERYEGAEPEARQRQTIVWIGLPENLKYLELIRPALARLAAEHGGLRLRVISSDYPDWPEVPIEKVPWSADTEVDLLRSAGIGVMPLADDDWTRGKCSFKLLQYMAAGLPCVGSAVGANREVVRDGESGFLAATLAEWERALRSLLQDATLARRIGEAGQRRIREHYDQRVVVPQVATMVEQLVGVGLSGGREGSASDRARAASRSVRG